MAKRQHKIRWRESDALELQRAINNFNAKLYRLKNKNPDIVEYLPDRVKKSDVIKGISTRADLNRVINSLKRFSRQGAETPKKSSRGAKSTQWEIDEFNHKQRIENARRTRERNEIEAKDVKSRGKKTGSKRSQMGSIKENSLKPSHKKFNNLSQREWELAKRNMDRMFDADQRDAKKELMKQNYIRGLENAGFSDEIIALVKQTTPDQFVMTVETDTEATFDFIYDPLEHKVKEEALKETWENANEKG